MSISTLAEFNYFENINSGINFEANTFLENNKTIIYSDFLSKVHFQVIFYLQKTRKKTYEIIKITMDDICKF